LSLNPDIYGVAGFQEFFFVWYCADNCAYGIPSASNVLWSPWWLCRAGRSSTELTGAKFSLPRSEGNGRWSSFRSSAIDVWQGYQYAASGLHLQIEAHSLHNFFPPWLVRISLNDETVGPGTETNTECVIGLAYIMHIKCGTWPRCP